MRERLWFLRGLCAACVLVGCAPAPVDPPSALDAEIPPLPAAEVPDRIQVAPGWELAYLIPPSPVNSACDVVVSSSGSVVVQDSDHSFAVAGEAGLESWSDGGTDMDRSGLFALASGAAGTVYAYHQPGGRVYRIAGDGAWSLLVQLAPEYQAVGDCQIDWRPGGGLALVVGMSWAEQSLLADDEDGTVRVLAHRVSQEGGMVREICFATDGTLYAATNSLLLELREDGSPGRTLFDGRPLGIQFGAAHGMAIGPDGRFVLTDGSTIYRVDVTGSFEVLATGFRKLEGLAVDPSGAVWAVSRFDKGLYRVHDGVVECVSPPNYLMTPQAMGVGPEGDVWISQDEAMGVGRYTGAGEFLSLYPCVASRPPLAGIAVGDDGTLYVAEAEPQFPSRILLLADGEGEFSVLTGEIDKPSGVAVRDGLLYVAATTADAVMTVDAAGTVATLIEGIDGPKDLAFGPDGTLYVLAGQDMGLEFDAETVLAVAEDLSVRSAYADVGLNNVRVMADGTLLVTRGGGRGNGSLLAVDPDGSASVLLANLTYPMGVAVEADGSILVSDHLDAVVYRLRRTLP